MDYASSLKEVSTDSTVQGRPDDIDMFEAPSAVLQTALTPVTGSEMRLHWDTKHENIRPEYHIILHFAEIQSLRPNDSRTFDIYLNGKPFFHSFSPRYLISGYVYTTVPYTEYDYSFSFRATNNSTLPPIINGLEIYAVMHLPELSTDSGDVDAIMAIQMEYQFKKNWMGDPCAPRAYAWQGLNCSYTVSVPPRIKTLNLSSSRLSGAISPSFAKLKAIETLDLSYNNLTGTIPGFLADISSLQLLNLRGNQLTGPVPAGLLTKSEEDFAMDSSARRRHEDYTERKVDCKDHQLKLESQQFTYKELENITNKFVRIIGKGGFGIVYHGFLENGVEVAVKLCSWSSSQGTKEFLAEAQSLARVRHKNLVTLVGYCKDENYLALVYEYMSQGSLREHLRGKAGLGRILSWGERLQIAVEAAQGLEYLHKGCSPPIIHRDVKTSNILLGEELVAKIADFGLSKSFHSDSRTHVSTEMVAGTPGYVDPECCDLIYSVVGEQKKKTNPGPGKAHIVHRVASKLARGNIEDAMDARLQGEYDANSVWKIVDLAMKCTAQFSTQRPTMSDVVIQLKESLALEAARERGESLHGEGLNISQNSAFELDQNESMSFGPSAR
ncbi:putative LRR receptor-like serine/threonine-protein kinase [Cocos nucifera]|uniref:non-specific serine/threonine protein kinase n=1 Tax=Cocos nucifera TaxID=13894 RepID=A0A8K0IBD1_COCNU|nr:putative LRR receptor-like serine/threonine-protein kinase [Cocos nucifera]